MKKLQIKFMLLVLDVLFHIVFIVDGLQPPYKQNGTIDKELYDEHNKMRKQLEEELS